MTRVPVKGEKPLLWAGSSYRSYQDFPDDVKDEFGAALGLAQMGGTHPIAKPWKGEGSGVFELVENYDGNAYRAIYTVRFKRAVYVLHAFHKKSTTGIKTAKNDITLVHHLLRLAEQNYRDCYGEDE